MDWLYWHWGICLQRVCLLVIFVDIDGTNGILSFGQPFITAKPTKLTGYYKYTPVNIDYMEQWDSKVDPDLKSGDSDQCIIYIALCTKNYEIRTNPEKSPIV